MSAFEISRDGAVAHLKLSRPEASNALDLSFWRDFGPALKALDATGEVRALVISGEGRNFCAGMDISVFSGGAILKTDTAGECEIRGGDVVLLMPCEFHQILNTGT